VLKAGRSLYAGASAIEIDAGQVQVTVVESGFEARNFGTEPAGDITVGVNSDADLTLLNDGMNLNRTKGISANPQMHLGVDLAIGLRARLQIGGGGGYGGCSRRRGIKHLVSLGKRGCRIGADGNRGCAV